MNTPQNPQDGAIEFPCDFPVKAMGLATDSLHTTVMEIVCKHAPDTETSTLKTRPSSNGKYLSVTVTVRATSQAQLDAIYTDLSTCEQVLMAL